MKQKILIVEDETALLYALQAELSSGGFETVAASSGEEGLKKIKNNGFSGVVLDLVLPGKVDGFEFLQQVKNNEKIKKVPIIVVSNLGAKDNVDRAMGLGAKGYLIKTQNSLEEILKKVKEMLTPH